MRSRISAMDWEAAWMWLAKVLRSFFTTSYSDAYCAQRPQSGWRREGVGNGMCGTTFALSTDLSQPGVDVHQLLGQVDQLQLFGLPSHVGMLSGW